MNTINLNTDVSAILQFLSESGLSSKTLKSYQHTGFGTIIRNYLQHGISEVTPENLDEFISDQRSCFEQGSFSTWKWRLIRRSCELLKQYAVTGRVDLSHLRPWSPELGRPYQSIIRDNPTEKQLANHDDVFSLAWQVRQYLISLKYTDNSIRHYSTEGLSVILNEHYRHGLTNYSEALTSMLIEDKRKNYVSGKTSRVSYQNLRKAAYMLHEMYSTGKIVPGKIPNWDLKQLSAKYKELLQSFCDNAIKSCIIETDTIKTAKSAIRTLLFELEARGYCCTM